MLSIYALLIKRILRKFSELILDRDIFVFLPFNLFLPLKTTLKIPYRGANPPTSSSFCKIFPDFSSSPQIQIPLSLTHFLFRVIQGNALGEICIGPRDCGPIYRLSINPRTLRN